ncbi:MAG TPA: alpha/beta hydrolase-fold protein [Vicinamibacterales bacterium]
MKAATKLAIGVVVLLLAAWPAHAQQVLSFGSAVTATISGGDTHSYSFTADAGDLVAGPLELSGPEAMVSFLDGAGRPVEGARIRSFYLGGTAGRRVGFVAPESGNYRVRIGAAGTGRGTYTLQLDRVDVPARMRGVSVAAKHVNDSERIQRLARDVAARHTGAVEDFWREVTGKGPLIESVKGQDRDQLVTFLWRQTFETHNVLVGWPMAVLRGDDYYMERLPNTDVWFKTIQIRRGSRFSYWLAPNYRTGDFLFTARLDPLNPLVFPDDPGATIDLNSVLDTPGGPDAQWHSREPAKRGKVEPSKFTSALLKNERDMWIYTPPGFDPAAGPFPLLVLFDGFSYVSAGLNNAPATLDNLINDGRIRPVVVCFLNSVNRAVELNYEGAGALGDAIVRELLPQLRTTHAISPMPRDLSIGGSSAGALAGALIALRHPGVFGNVLSQSGAFRLRTSESDEPNTISQRYAASAKLPIRFYLETGIYENVPSAGLPLHEMVLDEGITASNRHFRDVLTAKGYDVIYRETATAHESVHWRATLADALMAFLNR